MTPLNQVSSSSFRSSSDVQFKVRTTSQTVNNSNITVNDDTLYFSVAANEWWEFQYGLIVDSSAVADFNYEFVAPIAAVGAHSAQSHTVGGGQTTVWCAFDSTQVSYGNGAGSPVLAAVGMGLIRNGANAGTLQLKWAQNTPEVSDTKLVEGSYLIGRKLST